MDEIDHGGPLFNAVSSSARQLFMLLRCISFSDRGQKAQVQISPEGLRFSVEQASVMEGLVFINKDLFTTFQYSPSQRESNEDVSVQDDTQSTNPIFSVSLPSLLETLQIFGLTDLASKPAPWSRDAVTAFDTHILGFTGLCKLSYADHGSPLSIIMEESGVKTTCELTTYEPSVTEDIPFARDALALKIIMRASWLFDAISELSAISPDTLTLIASPTAPYFSLSASGPLGSTAVEFSSRDKTLLETFQVAPPKVAGQRSAGRIVNSYSFKLIKYAQRAMSVASKVSVRGDEQGVLSLQFMIEVEPGKVSFIDFRFVPLAENEATESGRKKDDDADETEDEEATVNVGMESD